MLGELGQLLRLDAVVRALIRPAGIAVAVALVDQHVLDPDPVGVPQQLRAAAGDTEDRVALGDCREVAQAVKAGGLEDVKVLFELLGLIGAKDDEGHSVSFSRIARRSGTPTATMSSTGASRPILSGRARFSRATNQPCGRIPPPGRGRKRRRRR